MRPPVGFRSMFFVERAPYGATRGRLEWDDSAATVDWRLLLREYEADGLTAWLQGGLYCSISVLLSYDAHGALMLTDQHDTMRNTPGLAGWRCGCQTLFLQPQQAGSGRSFLFALRPTTMKAFLAIAVLFALAIVVRTHPASKRCDRDLSKQMSTRKKNSRCSPVSSFAILPPFPAPVSLETFDLL